MVENTAVVSDGEGKTLKTLTIQQAYKFALAPTPTQRRMLLSHAGGARFAYNWGLSEIAAALDAREAEKAAGRKPETQTPNHFDLCKMWTAHKDAHRDTPDERGRTLEWVGQNFVGTYQAALRDAAGAWKNFFDSKTGRRVGRRMGRPKYKSRHRSRVAFQVHGAGLKVPNVHKVANYAEGKGKNKPSTSRYIQLPKIGEIRTYESTRKLRRRLDNGTARLVRGTVSQHSDGRWYIALTVEVRREIRTAPSARQKAGGTIGVDLGVRDIATCSDGSVIANPRHLSSAQRKLVRLQQALSRTAKGSKRREKARRKLAKAHARVGHLRLDATQKATTAMIHAYERIVVEGWDVQRLAQYGSQDLPKRIRRDRNRSLADANLGATRWQLQSKAAWYGATVEVAPKDETTGRTCSVCGTVKTKPVPLEEEDFRCVRGHVLGRRLNTARLLARLDRREKDKAVAPSGGETRNARGEDVRPKSPRRRGQSSVNREARSLPRGGRRTGTPDP